MVRTQVQPNLESAFDDLELLAQVAQLWTEPDLHFILREVVKLAAKSVGALRASLLIQEGDKADLSNFIVGDNHFLANEPPDLVESVIRHGLAGWVMRHKRGAIIDDTTQDERWYSIPGTMHHASSALAVPFMLNRDTFGVITFVHDQPHAFTERHLRLMTVIMQQVALVAQNTQNVRQAEFQRQQLEAILQAIPDILLVLNGHYIVVLASDAVETLLRGRFRRSVIGLTLNELSTIDPIFGQLHKLLEAAEKPQHEWSFEARSPILNRDFLVHIRPRSTTALHGSNHHSQPHPHSFQEPQPDGYIILLNDVTALRNLTRFKDEMLRLISHDLRTPLVVITGYADLLSIDLADTPNPALQQYVQGIFQASERMDKMLNNMLRAQQVQTTPEELHERVDLKALALEMMQDLMPLAARKQIQVDVEITPDDIPSIDGDAVMLRQSMENFVSNAIKYTPEGGHIIMRVSRDETAFHFEVEDNGVGIAPDDLPRLFQEYYRGDKSETHPGEGIGLGLALVRNVIREHGGDVWVESEVGKGSIFGFWLPLTPTGER